MNLNHFTPACGDIGTAATAVVATGTWCWQRCVLYTLNLIDNKSNYFANYFSSKIFFPNHTDDWTLAVCDHRQQWKLIRIGVDSIKWICYKWNPIRKCVFRVLWMRSQSQDYELSDFKWVELRLRRIVELFKHLRSRIENNFSSFFSTEQILFLRRQSSTRGNDLNLAIGLDLIDAEPNLMMKFTTEQPICRFRKKKLLSSLCGGN